MELLTAVILLQVLGAFQALPTTSYPVFQWNNTDIPKPSESDHFNLSGICAGVVMTHTHTHGWIPAELSLTNRSTVAQHICRHLGCGEVHEVRQNATTVVFNSTCATDCVFKEPKRLHCNENTNGICFNITEIHCTHQAIRLANGTNPCQGRVEVYSNRTWGSVCDDGWNLAAGHVVCAQLGCGLAHKVTGEERQPFPSGSGPIHLDELNCTGTEKHLWQCKTRRTGHAHDCGHKEDAGVVCTGGLPPLSIEQPTTRSPPNWTTGAATSASMEAAPATPGLQAAVAGCIVLSVALILVLASNVILCGRQKRRTARVIHQTYNGSTSNIIRERSEQEEPDVNLLRVTTEYGPNEADDSSSTSSCDSDEMNYYIKPIATTPSVQAPKAPHSPGPVSKEIINGNDKPGGDSDLESGEDYENTGIEIHNLLKSETILTPNDLQNDPSVHDPHNLQRAASTESLGSSGSSSEEDYQNMAFHREMTLPYPECQPSSEQLTSLPTNENYSGSNHYNRGHIPESYCDQDDSCSTSSGDSYVNVPAINKADCSRSTHEDPADQSSSDSDYDEVAT
ncbi:T-cell differentiation antigen CD6 isoform X2 [Alosa sapidissima]|uniref:T-cell differentiation antigen CD6 isoform X2 n=1 Tax=Alosa sapidissima TaxID=34773 RepID=UPI001C089CA2|nr:T-cell differentiation antigen CD6 isoform X2 [Alosa sapidissima]